jgi:hypothetical protein
VGVERLPFEDVLDVEGDANGKDALLLLDDSGFE